MHDLWHALHDLWPEGSVFRYFARRPSGRVFGCAIDTLPELVRTARWADANGWNSYWQMNPTQRRTGTKCSAEDIDAWCFLPLDLDPSTPTMLLVPHDITVQYPWDAAPWVIDSGRGVQLLFPFQPISPDRASRCMSYWLHRLAQEQSERSYIIDTSCSDLPRVMRLPGTINQKTGNRAEIIGSLCEPDEWLGEWLLQSTPASVWETQTVAPVGNLTHWHEYRPHLTVAARRFLNEGSPSPGRHRQAAAAMLSLIEQGASQGQVLEALHHGAALCEPTNEQLHKDMEDMVLRRFNKISKKVLTPSHESDTLLKSR